LTIGKVNNNKDFLEDYTYSNKRIERLFIDEECEVAEILKAKAESYLADVCVPRASYQLNLTDLGDTVALGDTIIIVDSIKKIKQKQRVVKIIKYLKNPEKSKIEISNLQVDFARDFVKSQKKIE
jgi:phage minor structural protein